MKCSWRVLLFRVLRELRILGLIILVGSIMWGTGYNQALHQEQDSQEACLSDFNDVSFRIRHEGVVPNASTEHVQALHDAQCCAEVVTRLALGKSWKHFDDVRGNVLVGIGIGFAMLVLSYVVFGLLKKRI